MSYGRLSLFLVLAGGCGVATRLSGSPDGGSPQFGSADLSTAPPSGSPDLANPPDTGNPNPNPSATPTPSPSPVTTSATVRVHYPVGTHTMSLRGDTAPLNWTTGVALPAGPDGTTFSYTFPTLSGTVQYKPLLDDTTWAHGGNYTLHPGQTIDIYPHFVQTAGAYSQLFSSFSSAILTYNQPVMVYLPASYTENTLARYPVLYMQDGANLFDAATSFAGEWKVDETLTAAGDSQAAGTVSINDIIVIGPYSGPDRNDIYTPNYDASEGFGGKGDLYMQMLVKELKPQVDMMLRTLPDAAHTGIMGSSLGGLISAYAGLNYASTFGLIGIMSPSTWWDNYWLIGAVPLMPNSPRPLKVYLDSGDSGTDNDDVTYTAQVATAFRGIGYTDGVNFDYLVQKGGQHSETYWAQRFPGAAQFLFGPR